MSKPIVTRLFVGSLLAIAGGLVLMCIAFWLGYVNSAYVMNGSDVVGIKSTGIALAAVALGVLGIVAMGAGAFGQFVAWIGAMLNTAQLHDKTWFLVLLLVGLSSFGFIATLVYVIAGPDGTAAATRPSAAAPPAVAGHSVIQQS